jgi:hypothetical protein
MKKKIIERKEEIKINERLYYSFLVIFEFLLFFLFLFLLFNVSFVNGVIGLPNARVDSLLEIGSAPPIINYIAFQPSSINLIPASTQVVNCTAEIFDNEGEDNINTVNAEFFDRTNSFYGDSDDNNTHYTNSSCSINLSYGDVFTVLASCTFQVYYYANPGVWNCTVNVTDFSNFQEDVSNSTSIPQLLAIGLPDTINYGTINATSVSNENITNVTNYGNVKINLSLEGYARTYGDGLAMNCSLGSNGTIPIGFEKYNLTNSMSGELSLIQFNNNYTNLTTNPVVKRYELNFRQNDTYNEAINSTYWRIYVPIGVAGNCTGNILFGATQTTGS